MKKRPKNGIRLVQNNADTAELFIYDEISFWGINAQQFVKDLRDVDAKTINVRINSPGGNVFDGMAIANALRQHDAHVVTHIDGLAASIASVIALAGKEVKMADNAFFMIHNAWTIVLGNAEQLRRDADLLDKIDGSIVNEYVKKTGQSKDQILTWMGEETWFDATEAHDEGFVDEVVGDVGEEAQDLFDLRKYGFKQAPAALITRAESDEDEGRTLRSTERALRDAGFSRSEARVVALRGLAALTESPEAADDLSALNESLQSLVSTLT